MIGWILTIDKTLIVLCYNIYHRLFMDDGRCHRKLLFVRCCDANANVLVISKIKFSRT